MKDKDYEELSNAIVEMRKEYDEKIDRLANANNESILALQFAKINHQKVLEELKRLVKELHSAADHTSGAFQYGRHIKVPDREETFERINKLLRETENR